MFICSMFSHLSLRGSRRYRTIFLLLLLPAALRSQTAERDSLLSRLKQSEKDTTQIRIMYNLVRYYEKSNLDSALYFLDKIRKLSAELKYDKGQE
ncbi:MAG: hypothetical protein J7527_05345, partial [Chitinophagaceae bacterium]|nr:hypothetical protein [Chitinophagaceae bacterium]